MSSKRNRRGASLVRCCLFRVTPFSFLDGDERFSVEKSICCKMSDAMLSIIVQSQDQIHHAIQKETQHSKEKKRDENDYKNLE